MSNLYYQRFAGLIFRGLIVESDAQYFQDLFCKIAISKFDNFEKIKPQGNKGDRKNDGYRRGEGIFYQVYSPEDPQVNTQNAVKKLIEDFNGLYSFWNEIEPIKEFNFVFNDKFKGSYPDLYKEITNLQDQYAGIKFYLFRADDLQRMFREMSPEKQEEILHLNSDEAILSFEAIGIVAKHLDSIDINDGKNTKLIAPDFEEKISFNNLSPITSEMLKRNYENISEVERYFSEIDNKNLRQDLQEKFTHLYNGAVKKFGEAVNEDVSDNIFLDVLCCSSSHSIADPSIRKAALSLMALYFESCDIYEQPK